MKPGLLWSILAAILATALGTALPRQAPPPLPSAPAPVIDVLGDSKSVELWFAPFDTNRLVAHGAIGLVNRGNTPVSVTGFAVGQSIDGAIANMKVQFNKGVIDSGNARSAKFDVVVDGDSLPSTANLVLRFDAVPPSTPAFATLAIHASHKDPVALPRMIVGSVLLAGLVLFAGYSQKAPGTMLKTEMGGAEWDFKNSWASNITIVGAVITTVLAFNSLPNVTQHLSRPIYESINLLWTLVITLAPALYSFFRRETNDLGPDLAANAPPVYHGFVGGFLVASLFTLWAVFGQIATLGLLLDELRPVHLLPATAVYTFWAMLGIIGAGLCYYGYRSVIETTEHQAIANKRRMTILPGIQIQAKDLNATATPVVAYQRLAASAKRATWHPL